MNELLLRLSRTHSLTLGEYERLIVERSPRLAEEAAALALEARRGVYGDRVYIRGLIEVGNYCRNDCLYCGIRLLPRGVFARLSHLCAPGRRGDIPR